MAIQIRRFPTKTSYRDLALALAQALGPRGSSHTAYGASGPYYWDVVQESGSSWWPHVTIFARLPSDFIFPAITVQVHHDKVTLFQPLLSEFAAKYDLKLTLQDVDVVEYL